MYACVDTIVTRQWNRSTKAETAQGICDIVQRASITQRFVPTNKEKQIMYAFIQFQEYIQFRNIKKGTK